MSSLGNCNSKKETGDGERDVEREEFDYQTQIAIRGQTINWSPVAKMFTVNGKLNISTHISQADTNFGFAVMRSVWLSLTFDNVQTLNVYGKKSITNDKNKNNTNINHFSN